MSRLPPKCRGSRAPPRVRRAEPRVGPVRLDVRSTRLHVRPIRLSVRPTRLDVRRPFPGIVRTSSSTDERGSVIVSLDLSSAARAPMLAPPDPTPLRPDFSNAAADPRPSGRSLRQHGRTRRSSQDRGRPSHRPRGSARRSQCPSAPPRGSPAFPDAGRSDATSCAIPGSSSAPSPTIGATIPASKGAAPTISGVSRRRSARTRRHPTQG
jgi:hypothetical protein